MSKGIITYKQHDVPPFSEKLLELQIKRIQIREREFELKKKQSDFLRQSLRFQSEDAKDLRRQEIRKEMHILLLICFAVFMFFSVIITAMLLDKDQLLSDVIQALGFIFGGGITGYGLGLRNGKDKKTNLKQT